MSIESYEWGLNRIQTIDATLWHLSCSIDGNVSGGDIRMYLLFRDIITGEKSPIDNKKEYWLNAIGFWTNDVTSLTNSAYCQIHTNLTGSYKRILYLKIPMEESHSNLLLMTPIDAYQIEPIYLGKNLGNISVNNGIIIIFSTNVNLKNYVCTIELESN